MKRTILLISWTIPPEPTGSAVIVGNLAKQFSVDEMIVLGERPHGRPAPSWRADWPRLHYIADGWPPEWRGERWWRRLQFPFMLWRSLRLARQHGCATVIAVFPNEEYLLLGYLTAKWIGASFVPYFHNTWAEKRLGLARQFAAWMQPRIFAQANHVFVMSEGMVELYKKLYPELKCSALVHSFNEDLPNFAPPPAPRSPMKVTISGNIYESCRDATARICQAIAQFDDIELTFLSGTPRSQLVKMGLLQDGVRYDSVSRDEVVQRLQEADVVLLPHGLTGGLTEEEYQTIFPTKTIEYLICGRPILAHSPNDCYLTRFLLENNCALVVDQPSVSELVKGLRRLRSDSKLRAELVRNALRAAERFQAPLVADVLRTRLQNSCHVSH